MGSCITKANGSCVGCRNRSAGRWPGWSCKKGVPGDDDDYSCWEEDREIMKASTAIKRAAEHERKARDLLKPVNEKLTEILEDDCAHIVCQAGDGMCVAYRGGRDNAAISFMDDFDRLLSLSKDDLLAELDKSGI